MDALELAKQAKKQNIIDIAAGFASMRVIVWVKRKQ
jgi:hypothetical protein